MDRDDAAPTFTDLSLIKLGGPAATAFFAKLEAAVPFDRLAASVADSLKDDEAAAASGTARRRRMVTG